MAILDDGEKKKNIEISTYSFRYDAYDNFIAAAAALDVTSGGFLVFSSRHNSRFS